MSRGHPCKIFKQGPRLNVRKYLFSCRIVDELNNLSSEAVIVKTVNSFKAKTDSLIRQGGGPPNEPAKAYCPDPEPTIPSLLKLR